jgi:hypothetical protein
MQLLDLTGELQYELREKHAMQSTPSKLNIRQIEKEDYTWCWYEDQSSI